MHLPVFVCLHQSVPLLSILLLLNYYILSGAKNKQNTIDLLCKYQLQPLKNQYGSTTNVCSGMFSVSRTTTPLSATWTQRACAIALRSP